jgi:starch synthase
LEKLGHKVIVITPKYRSSKGKTPKIGKHIKVHFIENDAFFDRDNLYGDKSGDYKDNLDRFSYFSRQTLEYLRESGFGADIIHCNDWQSSLIPVYLQTIYRDEKVFKKTKCLLTIHNIAYQGIFEGSQFSKIGIGEEYFNIECLEYYGNINLLKGGIVFSSSVNTVSPTYAEEIQAPELGYGLDGVLRRYKYKLSGILNGIDYDLWNPAKDKRIKKNYSIKNIDTKYINKEDLQKTCRLEAKKDLPLIGIVSRLAEQKGIEILAASLDEIVEAGAQFILLGTGDAGYHNILERLKDKHPGKASINLTFDITLAQKIYAGCDIFLMPSKYEPCGLGQMISLKYGTIPLVRKTGGLADTVEEFTFENLSGNGFVFCGHNKKEFLTALKKALKTYRDKKLWRQLVKHAMKYDFSWDSSARAYSRLYEDLVHDRCRNYR